MNRFVNSESDTPRDVTSLVLNRFAMVHKVPDASINVNENSSMLICAAPRGAVDAPAA